MKRFTVEFINCGKNTVILLWPGDPPRVAANERMREMFTMSSVDRHVRVFADAPASRTWLEKHARRIVLAAEGVAS